MADLAQVVAAVAAGALLSVATMLAFKLYGPRRMVDRERMINAAAESVVQDVETFRQQVRASLPEGSGNDAPTAQGATTEVRSKTHLRMVVNGEAADVVSHPSTACNRSQSGPVTRRRPVRESRP